jgi:hypothetical protein
VDARGPGALAVLAAAHGGAAALLVAGCLAGGAPIVLAAAAGLAGVFAPPLIATARAMWPQVAGPELAGAAHALNAGLADGAQLLSPGLTGAVAALASPALALAALVTGATSAAALLASAGWARAPAATRRASPPMWGPGLRTVVVCDAGMGVWIGALEVAVTAVAARAGAPVLAAIPLSASAVGGLAASVWSGTRRGTDAGARYMAGCWVAAVALALTPAVGSLAGIAVLVTLAGAGFGLLGVALFQLLDRLVPADRAVEAFTWLTTAQAAGTAAGAALAGALATGALWLVAGSAIAVAIAVLARRRTLSTAPPG